jgi:hypothetical protein
MALDLIAASEGVLASRQGEALVASFPSFELAILAARRLQWAVQGFSESGGPQAISIAVLVHSPEDASAQTAGGALPHFLEQAEPGEILLTEEVSRYFENMPGFPLQEASGNGLRRLAWRDPESQTTRSFDEQIVSQLVEQQAAQKQSQAQLEQPAPPDTVLATDAGTGNLDQIRSTFSRARSRWVMGAVAVAAVILAVVALLEFSHTKPNPAPAQAEAPAAAQVQNAPSSTAATQQQPAQGGEPLSATPARPGGQDRGSRAAARAAKNGSKSATKLPEQPATENQPPTKARVEPPAQRGRCDLESSQYSGQIAQAWKNLGRGKYADAQREFEAVLACDPNNANAREGLERARMAAREADGHSDN